MDKKTNTGLPILKFANLSVSFGRGDQEVKAVRCANLEIRKGETLALVGESGSGKSVTALSALQLLPYPTAHHPSGSIRFDNKELLGANEDTLRGIRGNRIGMIFQEPMTSLNPLHTLEKQIGEVLFLHKKLGRVDARKQVLDLLELLHRFGAIRHHRRRCKPQCQIGEIGIEKVGRHVRRCQDKEFRNSSSRFEWESLSARTDEARLNGLCRSQRNCRDVSEHAAGGYTVSGFRQAMFVRRISLHTFDADGCKRFGDNRLWSSQCFDGGAGDHVQ